VLYNKLIIKEFGKKKKVGCRKDMIKKKLTETRGTMKKGSWSCASLKLRRIKKMGGFQVFFYNSPYLKNAKKRRRRQSNIRTTQ
jgi:hypothetical protein